MGGGWRACQGVGIGIVMHIKRGQRRGAAVTQVGDIAFLITSVASIFHTSNIRSARALAARERGDLVLVNAQTIIIRRICPEVAKARGPEKAIFHPSKLTAVYILFYVLYVSFKARVSAHDWRRVSRDASGMRDEQDGINSSSEFSARRTRARKFDRSTSCRCVNAEQNSNLSHGGFTRLSRDFSRDFHCRENPVRRSTFRISILFYPEVVSSHCHSATSGSPSMKIRCFNVASRPPNHACAL